MDAFVRFLNQEMIRLSINPDALGGGGGGVGGGKLRAAAYQLCQPANSGAYHAARSNKKGIRQLTAQEEQSD